MLASVNNETSGEHEVQLGVDLAPYRTGSAPVPAGCPSCCALPIKRAGREAAAVANGLRGIFATEMS